MTTATFDRRTNDLLAKLRAEGLFKHLQMIDGPMDAEVNIRGYGKCLCFCSNNYLG